MNDNIKLVILNITSWVGCDSEAEHLYGKIILSDQKKVTIDNICEWNVNHLGEVIELKKEMTFQDATMLDKKDDGNTYRRAFMLGNTKTNRFNSIEEVVNAGIEYYNSLNLNCPFITLYEGEKYDYNGQKTIIIQQ